VHRRHHAPHPPRHALPPVDRLPPRDREQPRLERRLAAESLQLLERRHERVLRHLVGLGRRSDRRKGGPEHRPPVPFDQRPEGLDVPVLGAPNERQIVGNHFLRYGLSKGHTVSRGLRRHAGWEK
jgi:hypothetical protein